uniref:Uncharacterized protein n=1 Tax=Fagus sylvatica TaxID=28930 RepID=A0A2N9FNP4_FAGSY
MVCGFAMALWVCGGGWVCFGVEVRVVCGGLTKHNGYGGFVMGFAVWVSVGCGGLGEANGGSGGGGFLVDLGDLLGCAFSLQFGEMLDCENLEGRFMGYK